jgi:hypothetical protein
MLWTITVKDKDLVKLVEKAKAPEHQNKTSLLELDEVNFLIFEMTMITKKLFI